MGEEWVQDPDGGWHLRQTADERAEPGWVGPVVWLAFLGGIVAALVGGSMGAGGAPLALVGSLAAGAGLVGLVVTKRVIPSRR